MFEISINPGTATLIAALIAAFVSMLSLWVNLRVQRRFELHKAIMAEGMETRERTREALRSLVELLQRLNTSVPRLVELAPQKEGDDLVKVAMPTLAIISAFFADTADHRVLGFPSEIKGLTKQLQKSLTKFFVFVDFERGHDQPHVKQLKEQSNHISDLIRNLTDEVEQYVGTQLPKLQEPS